MDILGLGPFQVQEFPEVVVYRLWGGQVCVACHHVTAGSDGRGKQGRGVAFPLKQRDYTLLGRPMPLPVAPARSLQERIQAGFLTVDGGKIHIHPRFDERGGNHPTGEPQGETPADLGQLPTAVGGVH